MRVCWLKAGPTPCGSYIRTGRSGHSGITNLNGGRRTKACDSITFCSHRICRSDSWTAVLTDGRVGKKTRATTRQHGSRLISRPESRFQRFFVWPSQQRKELPFPARLCIRVNSHSQFDAVYPSADLSSSLLSVTKPLAMHSPVQMANLAIFDHHVL